MEKDIELVEEFINICEINFKFYEQPNVVIISDTVEAIKNLINRNKELEKLELEHQKINGNLREKIKELEHKYQRALSDLLIAENTKHTCPYIPTSGVTCDVKEKLKKVVDESIPKGKNIITGKEEYQPNTNANSYLTQKILEMLGG